MLKRLVGDVAASEHLLLCNGRLLSEMMKSKCQIQSLGDVEFKVFSQWGDDGIIQWLVGNLDFPNKSFVEFGVEDYRESNTRFLMMNDNWSGLVLDGSEENVASIVASEYYWKYQLDARAIFVNAENINEVLRSSGVPRDVGILHIDVDGNDYWIWKAVDCISPVVAILEYNSVFGPEREISVPYDKNFVRTSAHFSNLYFGASLAALWQASADKGYSFVGCNSAGNNAYFVRSDKLNESVRECSLQDGYVASKFRESRNKDGSLSCVSGSERIQVIKGMPVINTRTGEMERL